jgi:hypothetical protein
VLFPDLRGTTRARANLDTEQSRFAERHPGIFTGAPRNPLLDPAVCLRMVQEMHRDRGLDWSYGGYLEDRTRLWKDSYLSATGAFVHLGVDLNVPQGTRIAVVEESEVVLVDDDGDLEGGWGLRAFVRPLTPDRPPVVLIFAHMQNLLRAPGDRLSPGDLLAEVGGPPCNGNWYPHLHIQAMREPRFQAILLERFDELDGYGHAHDLPRLRHDFPDPLSRFPEFADDP